MQEANVAILGLFVMGRPVPQLGLTAQDTGQTIVTGSANCSRLLYGALQRDGADAESLRWLEVDPKIAQLEARLDKYGLRLLLVFSCRYMRSMCRQQFQHVAFVSLLV